MPPAECWRKYRGTWVALCIEKTHRNANMPDCWGLNPRRHNSISILLCGEYLRDGPEREKMEVMGEGGDRFGCAHVSQAKSRILYSNPCPIRCFEQTAPYVSPLYKKPTHTDLYTKWFRSAIGTSLTRIYHYHFPILSVAARKCCTNFFVWRLRNGKLPFQPRLLHFADGEFVGALS